MKIHRLLLIFVWILSITACRSLGLNDQILGEWQLQSFEQMSIYGKTRQTEVGNRILIFYKNQQVHIFEDGKLKESYQYSFNKRQFPDGTYSDLMLFFDNMAANFILKKDQLSISWQASEGGNEIYQRKK